MSILCVNYVIKCKLCLKIVRSFRYCNDILTAFKYNNSRIMAEEQKKSIIIGSSNVYRFVPYLDKQLQDIIIMQRCTSIEVFKVKMDSLKTENDRVIITVIENFLADAVKKAEEEKKEETIESVVEEALKIFFEVVETAATRLPGTRCVFVLFYFSFIHKALQIGVA